MLTAVHKMQELVNIESVALEHYPVRSRRDRIQSTIGSYTPDGACDMFHVAMEIHYWLLSNMQQKQVCGCSVV